jgi:DNA-binding helix-hairpin-helix protein with protein kinase domain/Flp pilus assembly protein TadD
MNYRDSSGKSIKLGRQIGRGGEGAVFACSHDPSIVAKIYTTWINSNKAEKLQWMARQKSASLLKISAWVVDTLHDTSTNRVVGFLMPAVNAKEIHELYSIKSRRTHFPEADWRFLIHACINVARCFYVVHEAGHVIGDVNQGNFVVLANGTIKLIDCDSFNVHADGRVYPCTVGVATHTPPELQGKALDSVLRIREHDYFGLAVLIFQLLFLGRHPYSGNFVGAAVDKTLEDSIKELRFAYGPGSASRQVRQPPGTLPLEAVSPDVAVLFERAFTTINSRPRPQEWIDALQGLSSNLTQCRQQLSHYYYKQLNNCPWCLIESNTGALLFPVVYSRQTSNFDIVTIERLLSSTRMPPFLSSAPVKKSAAASASPEVQLERGRVFRRLKIASLFDLDALVVLAIWFGASGTFLGGLIVFLICVGFASRRDVLLRSEVQEALKSANEQWKKIDGEWRTAASTGDLREELAKLRKRIEDYKALPDIRLKKLQEVERQAYRRQLDTFLDKHRIENANISGIGLSRVVTLMSNGIETAADVERSRVLSIYGFGPTYAAKLLNWRAQLERKFRFNPSLGVSNQDRQKIEYEISNLQAKFGNELQASVPLFKRNAELICRRNESLIERAMKSAELLAEAETNSKMASLTIKSGAALGGLWLAASFATAAITVPKSSSPPQSIPSINNSNSVSNSNQGNLIQSNTTTTNSNSNLIVNANGNIPMISLSDDEIRMLPIEDRERAASKLYEEGVGLTKSKQFLLAEGRYREAIRYDSLKANYHHELGYALYRQSKFDLAKKAFEQAIALDPQNQNTKGLLGQCLIGLKKWKDAKFLYLELRKITPGSFQYQYNLGISAEAEGDHFLAIDAFERAVLIKPSESQAHFQLGLRYIGVGRISDAEEQYQILRNLHSDLAPRLNDELDNWR